MHDLHLLHQAQPALLGGGCEGPGGGDDLPLDGVGHPCVLQPPDVPCQRGPHPLSAVPECVRVVVVSGLPLRLGQANVGLVHLANCGDRIYVMIFLLKQRLCIKVTIIHNSCWLDYYDKYAPH